MTITCRSHVTRGRPGSGGRIIDLCTRQRAGTKSSRDEYLSTGQERGGVSLACRNHTAGVRPGASGRVIDFRARQQGRSVAVWLWRAVTMLPVLDQAAVAAS